jgi:hypothetical protein
MSNLERRLKKLEDAAAEAAQSERNGVEWQMGYCQELPADYVGEKHVALVTRLPNGYYEWEERPGPGPVDNDGDAATLIRVIFVKGRDGVKVPYKLGAWRELEEDKEPAVSLGEPKAEVRGCEVPSPDNGDPLARIRALLAAPPSPQPQTQPPFRPSPAPPPWSWA